MLADMYVYLKSLTPLTNIVGTRLFPHHIPQGISTFPVLTFQQVNISHGHHLDAGSGVAIARVQVDCWGDTLLSVETLGESVRSALQSYQGGMGTTNIHYIQIDSEQDLHELKQDGSDNWLYRRSQDYLVKYTEGTVSVAPGGPFTGGGGGGGTYTPTTPFNLVCDAPSTKGITVKGAADQYANLTEWRNSIGQLLAKVNATGGITCTSLFSPIMGISNGPFLSWVSSNALQLRNFDDTDFGSMYVSSLNADSANVNYCNTSSIRTEALLLYDAVSDETANATITDGDFAVNHPIYGMRYLSWTDHVHSISQITGLGANVANALSQDSSGTGGGLVRTYNAQLTTPKFIGSSNVPSVNGEMTFHSNGNTQIIFKLKGSDGVVRSGSINLS